MVDPPTGNSGLSRDTWLAIIIGLIGIGGILFTLDWIVQSGLVACAVGLTIYAALRHSGSRTLRAIGALIVIGLFVGLSWRPIWEDFHQKYPTVGWHSTPQPVPQPQAAPILESRAGKMLLVCLSPPGDRKAIEAWKEQFRNAAEVYGEATSSFP